MIGLNKKVGVVTYDLLSLITPKVRTGERAGIAIQIDPDARRKARPEGRASGTEMEIVIGSKIIDAVEQRDPGWRSSPCW